MMNYTKIKFNHGRISMNYLMCSVGRRGEIMKDFRLSMEKGSKIVGTDNSKYAPALYLTDVQYIVPLINDSKYVDILIEICKKEKIDVVTTFIDPEIMLLADNRNRFKELGIEVLAPYSDTAKLCFDKYEMFKYLSSNNIPTVRTWGTFDDTMIAVNAGEISFPVFVKPRTGSGSVGARKIYNEDELRIAFEQDSTIIAQELMDCEDLDADVYVDTITHEPVAIFSKKKIATTIGGANKTISFKDEKLFDFIKNALKHFKFNGPIDIDFFYRDGQYYLSEINPRFGGAYLHAYGSGVDFIRLIENNLKGNANKSIIGEYQEGIVMMMYDSVVICKPDEMIQ